MARLSIRDFPDDLHQQLVRAANKHERSLEGETRYALARYIESLHQPQPEPAPRRETWQRQTGKRLEQLFDRLREDDVFAWGERHDVPHLAQALGEVSPAPLMDIIDGRLALSFEMAEKLAKRFSCSTSWLLNGAGSMFPYPEIGGSYSEFIEPAKGVLPITIKLVRICQEKAADGSSGRHDGTLLIFRIKDGDAHIEAGYSSTRFYLGDGMGAGGQGNLKDFVGYLNKNEDVNFKAYNFFKPLEREEAWGHHPQYFLKGAEPAGWLEPLLRGVSPGNIKWVTDSV